MVRAGLFIGVNQTGKLVKLNDAALGARAMHQWALSQGMVEHTQARLVTDEGGQRVTPDQVFDAVSELMTGGGVDQFILYFAGHGVNIARCEHWLLSDAPLRANAAINVNGSVELARYCGAQHVVVISDACRVAPEGIQAQSVRGQEIFPNDAAAGRAKPVDQFYACLLGRTAAEVQDPAQAASGYQALYTHALLEALHGRRPELLQTLASGSHEMLYLRPLPLGRYLEAELPRRIKQLNLLGKLSQSPDAILAASDDTWVSCHAVPTGAAAEPGAAGDEASSAAPSLPAPPVTPRSVGMARRSTAPVRPSPGLQPAESPEVSRARAARQATQRAVEAGTGPDHFETQCGFKLKGAALRDAVAGSAGAEILGDERQLLRLHGVSAPCSVALQLADGRGTVLPALPGYLTALTFDEDDLVDVSYEPAANNLQRWPPYAPRAAELRTLRAQAAATAQHGRLKLNPEGVAERLSLLRVGSGVDPTLALYTAYPCHDLQLIDTLETLSDTVRADLSCGVFDLALLARQLWDSAIDKRLPLVPFVPLMARGWSLLRANRVRLHPRLKDLQLHLLDSVWSLYDRQGTLMLMDAVQSKELT